MSGYGTHTYTCGRCGDTYSATGVVGDIQVARWERKHREKHRVADMSPEERDQHIRHQSSAFDFMLRGEREAAQDDPRGEADR